MSCFPVIILSCFLVSGIQSATIVGSESSATTATSVTPPPSTSQSTSQSTSTGSTAVTDESSTSDVSTESSVTGVTEIPEELTTIIEIEDPGNGTDAFDFVNLPGYGVVDDANSTLNSSVFSCFNRRYGYYADIPKKCLMFHLCYPVQEPTTGQILFQRFSFVCSDNAIFDQQHLVCVDNETLSYSCTESEQYYISSNDKLIEQMQQQQAQQYLQQQGQGEQQMQPQQLTQAQMIQLQQHLQQQAAQAQQEQNQRQDPAALAAAEAAYREYARQLTAAPGESDNNSTEIDAAQQYAILEQLFG